MYRVVVKASRSTFSTRPTDQTDQTDPPVHDLVTSGRTNPLFVSSFTVCRSQCLPVGTCMMGLFLARRC